MNNNEVITRWLHYRSGKSSNGNLRTNGNELYSYNMVIGKIHGLRHYVLDVSGVWSYSVTTTQHVSDASYGAKTTLIIPKTARRGYSVWFEFPRNHETYTVLADSRLWKTRKGAEKNLAKVEQWLHYYYPNQVLSVEVKSRAYIGYSIYATCRVDYDLFNTGFILTPSHREAIYSFAELLADAYPAQIPVTLYYVPEQVLLDAIKSLKYLDRTEQIYQAEYKVSQWQNEYYNGGS